MVCAFVGEGREMENGRAPGARHQRTMEVATDEHRYLLIPVMPIVMRWSNEPRVGRFLFPLLEGLCPNLS